MGKPAIPGTYHAIGIDDAIDHVDLAHEADFRLGPLTVMPSQRRVRGPRGTASLEPRVMQVLVALADPVGTTLSRDDLIQRCWDTRIVGDASINRVISLLRTALREAGGEAVTIETIPKVGYRLLHKETRLPPRTVAPEASIAPPHAGAGLMRWLLLLGAVVLLAVAGWAYRSQFSAETKWIAVLPFESAAPEDDFFAVGLKGELEAALAATEGLRLRKPDKVERLAKSGLAPREIARRSDADAVISGSTQRRDDDLEVRIVVFTAGSPEQQWSGVFDAETDPSGLLVEQIVAAIRSRTRQSAAGGGRQRRRRA